MYAISLFQTAKVLQWKEVTIKGLIIAGTESGCGKTTIALSLMAAMTGRGLKVAPFKVGPDFIDPGHHTRITGITSRNLDGWMLSEAYNVECFRNHTSYADIAIVEGVMGLFDGYDGKSEAGSTAQMAKWLNLPVVLVVDAKGMAQSAAALIQGFERFDRNLTFAGVLFNNIGSKRHLKYLQEALIDNVKMPCLGGIIHNKDITIPERHLGLVTQHEYPLSDENTDKLADTIEKCIDLEFLLNLLPDIHGYEKNPPVVAGQKGSRVRIGVAMDNAFCFYYQDNLDMLIENGAELVFFSPIKDNNLPENLDGIYLGGGYPELFARQLASNSSLRRQIRKKSMDDMPIYGECGGFMYLCRELCDLDGNIYPMTGCFPFTTRMLSRLKSLGYRETTLTKDTVIGKRGQTIRGHEFHYSELTESAKNIETVYRVAARAGIDRTVEGYQVACTLGSYIHLHFGSRPECGKHFVETCLAYKYERIKHP